MIWKTYSIFGLTMASDFPFISRLGIGSGEPDFTFTVSNKPPLDVIWSQNKPNYSSIFKNEEGENFSYLFRLKNCDVLRFTGKADFYISNDRIICHLLKKEQYPLVEIQLLGSVLSYWLERQGLPTIHASANNVDGCAVAFLSSNKGGKTSLAASLMQAGYPLITDDVMPIELHNDQIICRPGYPTMRMWPDEAEHFIGHSEDLPIVHPQLSKRRVFVGSDTFGSFYDMHAPLSCLYIPERIETALKGSKIEIMQLSQAEGLIELVRHSFISRMVERLGWQPRRLEIFTKIVLNLPIRRLIYPSGYKNLSKVCNSILDDVKRISN